MNDRSVFITRRIPQAGLDVLSAAGVAVDMNPLDRPLTREELIRSIGGHPAVICQVTDRIDSELIEAVPNLRVISSFAVGFNHIDVTAATRRGVLVTNTPDVLTDATADLTWALILSAARRVVEGDRYMRTGQFKEWRSDLLLGMAVSGKTLGIVGAGRIGKAVAERSAGFRMRVIYAGRHDHSDLDEMGGRKVELDDLLRESDIVTLHVPLSPETRHLIGKREFGLMKPTAILINTSRGPVVDETELVEALRSGRIAGAGLDVYENEPQMAEGLAGLATVTLLPHLGSATVETRNRMAVLAAENVTAALEGRMPPAPVNPEVLKHHKP